MTEGLGGLSLYTDGFQNTCTYLEKDKINKQTQWKKQLMKFENDVLNILLNLSTK